MDELRPHSSLLPVHEMIGVDSESRNAVDFKDLFMCGKGATPSDLVERGIYSQIAIPLKGGMATQASRWY